MLTWRFTVSGVLLRADSRLPVHACEVITESGVRDEASPFDCEGVGALAVADERGAFRCSFVTRGAERPIFAPEHVSVFIRVGPAAWKPYVAQVVAVHAVGTREMALDVGQVLVAGECVP